MRISNKKLAAAIASLFIAASFMSMALASSSDSILAAAAMIPQLKNGGKLSSAIGTFAKTMGTPVIGAKGTTRWDAPEDTGMLVICSMADGKVEVKKTAIATCIPQITNKMYTTSTKYLMVTGSFEEGGEQSMSGYFVLQQQAKKDENGKLVPLPQKEDIGMIPVQITLDDVYEGTTSLDSTNALRTYNAVDPEIIDPNTYFQSGSSSTKYDTVPSWNAEYSELNPEYQDTRPYDPVDMQKKITGGTCVGDDCNGGNGGLCTGDDCLTLCTGDECYTVPGGTQICTGDDCFNLPGGGGTSGGGVTPGGTDIVCVGDECYPASGGGLPSGTSIDTGDGGGTSGTTTGNNIGSTLGDLLNSFNSGDEDWSKSSLGNDGESSLDDYFNGVDTSDSDAPGGLTDDILGVDDDLYGENEGQQYYQDGEQQDEENTEGASEGTESGVVATSEEEPTEGEQQEENEVITDLASLYQRGLAGLDGGANPNVGDDSNAGLLGAINGDEGSSLSKRLMRLASGDPSVTDSPRTAATEQELYNMIKEQLLANGLSIEDLKRGTNYSPNSSWTDPVLAWDFNRITTLLKKKKINLSGTAPTNNNTSANNGRR